MAGPVCGLMLADMGASVTAAARHAVLMLDPDGAFDKERQAAFSPEHWAARSPELDAMNNFADGIIEKLRTGEEP